MQARRLETHAGEVVVGTELAKHLLLAKAVVVGGRRKHFTTGAQSSVTLFTQARANQVALARFHLQFPTLQRREGIVVEIGLLLGFPRHISRLGGTWTHTTFFAHSTNFSFLLLKVLLLAFCFLFYALVGLSLLNILYLTHNCLPERSSKHPSS